MSRWRRRFSKAWSRIRSPRGQTMAIFALVVPAVIGAGALAVDVGYMYAAKGAMQNAADAGARAGAYILGSGGGEGSASSEASSFANQNLAAVSYVAAATPSVSFPTSKSITVDVTHSLPLYFASVLGFGNAPVAVSAKAELVSVKSLTGDGIVPLAIYCNNASGCNGQLAVNQVLSGLVRHCGNFFGTSSSTCSYSPDTPASGETFLTGITFDTDESNGTFKNNVYNGYSGTVSLGQVGTALSGTRQGWESAMTNRLAEGRNEMTFVVIEPVGGGSSSGNIRVVDFVRVRIDSYTNGAGASTQDQFGIEIIPHAVSSTAYAESGEGLDIGSVVSVRLSG